MTAPARLWLCYLKSCGVTRPVNLTAKLAAFFCKKKEPQKNPQVHRQLLAALGVD
jgi:hypothetical protein